MPIPPPVKPVMRKDLLLGGAAGTLLCVALVAAALSIGPLLGIDWGDGTNGGGNAEAANLPALPHVSNPSAAAQVRAPRILSTSAQPTTRVAAPATPAAADADAPQATNAPSITGRSPQTTTPAPSSSVPRVGAGTPDAATAPAPAAPALAPVAAAAAIPATPAAPAQAAKKVNIRVASVAVAADDNGSPELRLNLALDGAGPAPAASVPGNVPVTLGPQLPSHAASTGPLALSAHVDVVDAPADDNSSDGSVEVPGMQMRVRMTLTPAADATQGTTPAGADAGAGGEQSESKVIALRVRLAASAEPADDPAGPPAPGRPAAPPAEPTEIRLDLAPAANPDNAQPQTE